MKRRAKSSARCGSLSEIGGTAEHPVPPTCMERPIRSREGTEQWNECGVWEIGQLQGRTKLTVFLLKPQVRQRKGRRMERGHTVVAALALGGGAAADTGVWTNDLHDDLISFFLRSCFPPFTHPSTVAPLQLLTTRFYDDTFRNTTHQHDIGSNVTSEDDFVCSLPLHTRLKRR